MNKRPALATLVLLLLCTAAFAQVKVAGVLAEGNLSNYWIGETLVGADGMTVTSLRQRVDATSGKWVEIARIPDNVIGMAAVGDRIAVATADGWRLLAGGSSFIGPGLSNNRVISQLAGEDDALWVLAGYAPGKTHDLFRWTAEQGWALMGRLPPEATAAGALTVRDGVPWIAYPKPNGKLQIDRASTTWEHVTQVPAAATYKLLRGPQAPLLATCDDGAKWTIYDLSADPPKVLQTVQAIEPSDVTVAGTSLRIVSLTKDGAKQQGFDDFGRGAAFGPDVIAQAPSGVPPANDAPNYLLIGLMTAAMVVALRSRTFPAPEALATKHIRIAPVGRRLAAGVIDAVPYLLAGLYVSRRIGTGAYAGDMADEVVLPILLGLTIYIVHVGASELIFGRSLGKFLFGLRVVTVEGEPAPAGRIVLRNLMRVVDVSAIGLPFLLMMFSPSGQRFGDMAARTLVVAEAEEAVEE